MDLLAIDRGSVVAPAGCGKTELIASALRRHSGRRPILVLTHTNAGVVALRARTARQGVPPSAFHVATIDGWAMRLISTFPVRSGHDPGTLGTRPDYLTIRATAAALVRSGHLGDILTGSYERVLVDEYQDCSELQHSLAVGIAEVLPMVVLGDPMQAIFDFAVDDPTVDWEGQALDAFPKMGELATPWRWINAGAERLGRWMLEAREGLACGLAPDLRGVKEIEWIRLDGGDEDHRKRLKACNTYVPGNERVLIIGPGERDGTRHKFASQTAMAVTVEGVELQDLMEFSATVDLRSEDATADIVTFASKTMTNVGRDAFLARLRTLRRGKQRNEASAAEAAALAFERDRHPRSAATLLKEIARQPKVRLYRPTIHHACLQAMRDCPDGEHPAIAGLLFQWLRGSCVTLASMNRRFGLRLASEGLRRASARQSEDPCSCARKPDDGRRGR